MGQSIRSEQIRDGEVKRSDLNVSETGNAVIAKVIAGNDLGVSSTGVDAGTGDVTLSLEAKIGIPFHIYNAGFNLATGDVTVLPVPRDITITGWTIIGNTTGSITVDIQKATYGDFPSVASIAGTAKPTLSSARKNTTTTLTGWSTSLSEGDILQAYVESSSGLSDVWILLSGQTV